MRHIHNHLFSNSLHRFSSLLWKKVCVCVYILWTFSPDCLSQVLEWLLHWHAWHPALLKLKKPGWQTSHLSPYTPTLHSHTPELRNTTRKDGESGWNTKHSSLYTIWCETNSEKKKRNIWPEFTDFISRTLLTRVTELRWWGSSTCIRWKWSTASIPSEENMSNHAFMDIYLSQSSNVKIRHAP